MANGVQLMQGLTPALAIATQFQRAMAYAITKTDVKGQVIRRIMTDMMSKLSIFMQLTKNETMEIELTIALQSQSTIRSYYQNCYHK